MGYLSKLISWHTMKGTVKHNHAMVSDYTPKSKMCYVNITESNLIISITYYKLRKPKNDKQKLTLIRATVVMNDTIFKNITTIAKLRKAIECAN